MKKSIIVQSTDRYIELPFGREKHFDDRLFVSENGIHSTKFSGGDVFIDDIPLTETERDCGAFTVKIFSDNPVEYVIDRDCSICLGIQDKNDIIVNGASAEVVLSNETLTILSGYLYRNGIRYDEGSYSICRGDCLYMNDFRLYVKEHTVICSGTGYRTSLLEKAYVSDMEDDFPNYKRSPRIIKREPTDRVEVKEPTPKPEKKRGAWITILMPLVMVCVTVAIGILMGRGIIVLMSATMMTASAAFSIVRIVSDKKDTKG